MVDLNDIVVKSSGTERMKNKTRISNVHLVFESAAELNSGGSWDSTYLMTKFLPPSDGRFKPTSVACRIADYDTAVFDLYLVVLQMDAADTLFRELPIVLSGQKRKKQSHVVDLRASGIVLKPAPFYLGYGFHTKPVPYEYSYRLYSTVGGQGTSLRIRDRRWTFHTSSHMPYTFPFSIAYLKE